MASDFAHIEMYENYLNEAALKSGNLKEAVLVGAKIQANAFLFKS